METKTHMGAGGMEKGFHSGRYGVRKGCKRRALFPCTIKVAPDDVLKPIHDMSGPYGPCGNNMGTERSKLIGGAVEVQRSANTNRDIGKPLNALGVGSGFSKIETGVIMLETQAQGIQRLMETAKGVVGRDGQGFVDQLGIVYQRNGCRRNHQGYTSFRTTRTQQPHRRRRHDHVAHMSIVNYKKTVVHLFFSMVLAHWTFTSPQRRPAFRSRRSARISSSARPGLALRNADPWRSRRAC